MLEEFEGSAFCKKYGCRNPDTWALATGATNHAYHLNLTPAVSLEVPTKGNEVEHYGLMFYERDRLDESQLNVVDELITTIDAKNVTDAVRRFVRANIERPVEQIRLAKSTRFGGYQLWVGKVGSEKVVSVEPLVAASGQQKSSDGTFKVTGQVMTAVVLLVPPKTSEDDLISLIQKLRSARADGSLKDMIPATTPGGSRGSYAVVAAFVMSDPAWATSSRLKSFISPATSDLSSAEREFGKRILAYYYYTSISNQEEGTIGYADEEHRYTTGFKKLF